MGAGGAGGGINHLKLLQICMLFQILDNIIGPGQRGAWEGQQVRYALLAPRYLGENPICFRAESKNTPQKTKD